MQRAIKSLLLASIIALVPSVVFAHVLKSDGDIGAIIHIDPEDSPIVGQPATFFFEFKDKTNKFTVPQCDCTVTIANRGQQVLSQPLTSSNSSLNSPAFQYTFPEKSLYTVVVAGSPKAGANFQSFSLSYDIRVDRGGDTAAPVQQKPNHTAHYIIFGGGFLALLILYLIERRKKTQHKKTQHNTIQGLCAVVALTGLLLHHGMAMADGCHADTDMRTQHQLACCSVPDVAVLNTTALVHEIRSFDIILDSFHDEDIASSERPSNKSPPVEQLS
jgi:hypothetical protein